MATEMDKEHVGQIINEFYAIGRSGSWKMNVNERVAEVFDRMLEEVKKCTKALNWVPRPPGGKATIAWLVKTLRKSFMRSMSNKLAVTCVQMVIRNWGRELRMASIFG